MISSPSPFAITIMDLCLPPCLCTIHDTTCKLHDGQCWFAPTHLRHQMVLGPLRTKLLGNPLEGLSSSLTNGCHLVFKRLHALRTQLLLQMQCTRPLNIHNNTTHAHYHHDPQTDMLDSMYIAQHAAMQIHAGGNPSCLGLSGIHSHKTYGILQST